MILLKLDGITGDSTMEGVYAGCIACTSASWNIERTFSESAKAGTQDVNVGVADLPPISLNKTFDAASVYLMQLAVAGGAVGSQPAQIFFLTTSNDTTNLYLEFKLFNPIVASWSISADEDERPTEELSLWYWKIWMQYYTTKDGKTYTSAGSKGWDRIANKSWSGTG